MKSNYSKNIKFIFSKYDLSVKAIADKYNKGSTTLNKIVNGTTTNPTLENILIIYEELLKNQKQLYKAFRLNTIVAYKHLENKISLGQIVFISEKNNILIKPIKINNTHGPHIEYTGNLVFTKQIYNVDEYTINVTMLKYDFTDEIIDYLKDLTCYSLFC